MTFLNQCLVVSGLAVAGLRPRIWSALVIVIGMACVTGVLISMLSVNAGIRRIVRASSDPNVAIVLASRAVNEFGADLTQADVATIIDAPGIAKNAAGRAIGDAEVLIDVPPVDGFAQGSLNIRGIGPMGIALRPDVRIIAGRTFATGHQELIVGIAASRVFHVKIGDKIIMPDGEWPIVGIFAGGGALESQLITDARTLMASTRRTGFGSVIVKLTEPDQFAEFNEWLTTNPTLAVTAQTQLDYDMRLGSQGQFYDAMAYFVGAVMSFGALFGAVNILYSSVRSRTREIATLRAIGYRPLPLAISVVFESLLLSILGATAGCLLAWALVDGHESGSTMIFKWSISPDLMALGLSWTAVLALLGSLSPAIRAAWTPVAAALREV
jgi:putative ABC transport system permease protein